MKLDGFSDFSLVGAGGNAHVWRAQPDSGGDPVAVKVMRGGGDEAVTRRFERERRLMAKLSELDAVVPILQSGVTEGDDPYIVMPLFTGGSLQSSIANGALDWREAVEHTRTIAKAVSKAHAKQILHLDIKPANVLLDESSKPHLSDFGIAEIMGSTASMSAAMMTPAFTPPERLADKKPTEQTDIYSLGATLYALLSGHPPFGSTAKTNPAAVITAVLNDPIPVDSLPEEVPESVRNIVLHSMAKDPTDRPKTMTEMSGMLTTALNGGFIASPVTLDAEDTLHSGATTVVRGAPRPETITGDQEDTSRSKAPLLVAAALLLILLTGGTVAALTMGGDSQDNATSTVESAQNTEETPASSEETSTPAQDPEADNDEDNPNSEDNADEVENIETEVLSETEISQDATVANSSDSSQGTNATSNSSTESSANNETSAPIVNSTDNDNETTVESPAPTVQVTQPTTATPAEPATPPPGAGFTASTSSTQTNTTIRFTSTSSGDVDSITWAFGDGSTASGSSVNHSYSSAGTYTVRMTATGNGGSDTATRTITVSAPAASAPPAPDNIGCQYLGNDTDVQWAFSPLPGLVDTYILEFTNGSRQDIGSQPGPQTTTDNFLRAIIAERDGVESATTVGSCTSFGGVVPTASAPGLPTGVTCRFHDFFTNASGVYTWSETWNWSAGANTTSFVMVINQDGNFINVNNGSSTTHTTVGVNGQSNSGRSVKGITAVGPGGETTLTIANCGAMGGTGWQSR